jgi:hypothetical protein
MSTKNDGSPAFPVNEKCADGTHHQTFMGMTLHDWFAGKVLQGICSHHDTWGLTDEQIIYKALRLASIMLRARGE